MNFFREIRSGEYLSESRFDGQNRKVGLFFRGKNIHIKSYYNYFLSYFIIILILIIISTSTCLSAIGMIKTNVLSENRVQLREVRAGLDTVIKNTIQSTVAASFDEKLKEFCKVSKSEVLADDFLLYSVIQEFGKFSSSLPEDSFFFSGKSDTIISFSGTSGAAEYLMAAYETEDARKITSHLHSRGKYSFLSVTALGGERHLLYFCDMNELQIDERVGKIVAAVDMDVVLETMKGIVGDKKCYGWSPGGFINPMESEVYYTEHFDGKDEMYYEVKDGNVVCVLPSDIVGWQYVSVEPEKSFFDTVDTMRYLVFVNIILMFVLGVAATVLLLKQNMKPIKKLVTVLEDMGIKTGNVKNEFDFIQNVVSAAVKEKEEIGEIVQKQNKALKISFLQNLIKGTAETGDKLKQALQMFKINLISNNFAVGVFCIKDLDMLFKEEKSLDVAEKKRMASIIMNNILEELISKHHLGMAVEISDMQVCLVNVSKERENVFYSDMESAVSLARENIRKYFSIDFTAAFGNVYSSIKYIPKSYDEALQTINYKNVVGIDGIFKYMDISGNSENKHTYSEEVERELISSIKCGKAQKAKEIITKIFDENIMMKRLSGQEISELMISVASSLLKSINSANESERQNYFAQINVILQMIGDATIDEIKEKMTEIIDNLCVSTQSEIKIKNGTIGEKAVTYIKENYKNPNLNAAAVAEALGVHAAYLSAKFKEQIGIGVLECLNKTRVENAKVLLRESDASIENISVSVGILSARSFARVFKKYEGMTPGEYRTVVK